MTTTTRIQLQSTDDVDPLASVRRAIAFADAMVELGATVEVVGELSMTVRIPAPADLDDDGPTGDLARGGGLGSIG